MEPTPQQSRAMRRTVTMQCFGALAEQLVQNGIVLLYLLRLGLDSSRVVLYLSIPAIGGALLLLPLAQAADRVGKKRVGLTGLVVQAIGWLLLAAAGMLAWPVGEAAVVLGLAFHALGFAGIASGWFALLSPLVPESMRGQFFGKLRFSWQLVGIGFSVVCAAILSGEAPLWLFQAVMLAVVAALLVRIVLYRGLPELERPAVAGHSLLASVRSAWLLPGFASFCCYLLLLRLATGGVVALFGLVEANVLGYSDRTVVVMGNLLLTGQLIGFLLGGRVTDRLGTKPLFLVCHIGLAIALALFLLREAFGPATIVAVAAANILYGLLAAASSVAISTETLALIPPEGKSVSTSLTLVMSFTGASLAGLFTSMVLALDLMSPQWSLLGLTMSAYDGILLLLALLVVVLVVTLGLVPSVIGRPGWVPSQT